MNRVLFVRRTYGFGGAEKILLDWLDRIDYSKYEVFVSSPADVFSEKIAERGISAKFIPLSEDRVTHIYGRYQPQAGINDLVKGSFWHFFPIWLRFLWRIKPDAVVLMEGDFFGIPLACVLAAFVVARGNVAMTVHSPNKLKEPLRKTSRAHFGLPGLGLWWYRQVWWPIWPWRLRGRLSRRVLAASGAIKDRIVSFYGYPAGKMGLVSHGVDTTRFRPCLATRIRYRQLYGIPDDAFVIVSTSRLSYEKGVDRLVRAFDVIASGNRDLWLLLVGDGPLKDDLERVVAECQRKQRIKLLGHVDDVSPILQASDVYVLASQFEGCPVALLEAMATGLICVVSRIPGPDEVVEHGRDGYLVEPTEEGTLAGLQEVLALNVPQRERMGRCAREKILEKYELQKAVEFAFDLLNIGPAKAISATADHVAFGS